MSILNVKAAAIAHYTPALASFVCTHASRHAKGSTCDGSPVTARSISSASAGLWAADVKRVNVVVPSKD